MAGMVKVARTGRRGGQRTSHGFTEINVTPLVDVMLVLLVIFMISAPMLTVGVPLDLPKTRAAQLNDQGDPVVVSVDASGRSYLHETPLEGEALIARLMVVTQSNPEAKIYVRGDAKLAYGRVMEVMGDIAAAGFKKVSLLAEVPAGLKAKPVVPQNIQKNPNNTQGVPTLQTLMPPQSGLVQPTSLSPSRGSGGTGRSTPVQQTQSSERPASHRGTGRGN
jgi:biopolymer transport protein TolR